VNADEDTMEDVQSMPAAAQQAEPEAQNGTFTIFNFLNDLSVISILVSHMR
jgi:hypothetical protein